MVDFDLNSNLLKRLGVKVVSASVDTVAETAELATGLRLRYVQPLAELDAEAVTESTGAFLQRGPKTFLHATGWLLEPSGVINTAVYSSGPIGRFTANDVLKKVIFEQIMAARHKR